MSEDANLIELSSKYYESARSELINRIALRDGAMLFYIASVGAYLNVVFEYHFKPSGEVDPIRAALYMAPLPVLSLIFSLMILQHHSVIGDISYYLRKEFFVKSSCHMAPHWDSSESLKLGSRGFMKFRLLSQCMILILPLTYELFYFSRWVVDEKPETILVNMLNIFNILFSIVVGLYVSVLHVDVHSRRREQHVE